MSQSSFEDELFGEAANEMREDVEENLAAAREELPPVDAVWKTDAENTLGALNALRSALDVGDAEEHLHDAKKWYAMGQRADAFEDADDLKDEIETIDAAISDIEDAREQVGELASTIPSLKGSLEELEAEEEEAEEEAEKAADEEEEDEE
jgi:chromosome segregation ATPase